MPSIIQIKDLDFSYDKKQIFNKLSLDIEKGTFTTIMGPSGCGKSTLAKIMIGMLNSKCFVKNNDLFINPKNIKEIRKLTGYLIENPSSLFMFDTVLESMKFILKDYGYSDDIIDIRINQVCGGLKITNLLNIKPINLSAGEKQLVGLAITLAHNPKLIIIDDGLSMVDSVRKEEIFTILKQLNNAGTTIINFTHDSEEMLYGTDVVLINDNKILLQEKLENAFYDSNIYIKCKVALPFIIDLSLKLKYYKVVDKLYFDSKKLVDDLWK